MCLAELTVVNLWQCDVQEARVIDQRQLATLGHPWLAELLCTCCGYNFRTCYY